MGNLKLLKAVLIFIIGVFCLFYVSNAFAGSYTIRAEWSMSDTTNLKEWKLFWSDTTGGPYTEIMVIPYDPNSTGPLYTSPASVDVTGSPASTVRKYFVMIACGDIPQQDGSTKYLCSEDSNEATYDFWIPAGQFSVPLNFEVKAQ